MTLTCRDLGELLSLEQKFRLGLTVAREYRTCDHPQQPLGQHVCSCQGCGPKCRGFRPPPHDLRSGIVIGTYGLPQLARLQVQIIRATCGNVPILIADDASEHEAAFREIESVTPGVTFAGSPVRLGHYAGDLSAFHKGLRWANELGLQYLCKLSQRFIHTAWNWLLDRVAELHASEHSVMMQDCWDNKIRLFVRSECMIFRVEKWAPLLPEFDREVLTNPTEYRIWHLVHAYFGEHYLPWPGMPTNRYQHMAHTIWHCVNLPQDYHNTAERFGVTLDAGFTTAGWQSLPGWKKG